MYPTKASSPTEIDFFCPDEVLFLYLEKLQTGSSLPQNVIADVNPFQHMPSNLPDGVWFFVHAGEKAHTSFGFWKIKGEACNLFSSKFFTGWRTTFEYYEGQAPHGLKTDWLMHEYWIVQRKVRETSKTKEVSSLFRVFVGGEVKQNDQKMQKMFAPNIVAEENQILSKQSANGSKNSTETYGSASSPQMSKDDWTVDLGPERKSSDHRNLQQENVEDLDYHSMGDFLELADLDIPPSPTSSSENSSCLTMSSDECFDSLDLLRELEHDINLDLPKRDDSCKSTTPAPLRLNVVLTHHPSSSGNSVKMVEEKWNCGVQEEQRLNRPRSGDSSGSRASSSADSITDGKKKSGGKRAKKRLRKYLCFIPF